MQSYYPNNADKGNLSHQTILPLGSERVNDNVNSTVNLSFSIFTSRVFLSVHLQRAVSTIKDTSRKQ